MAQFTPTQYELICVATGEQFTDAGWTLDYAGYDKPSLVRAAYAKKQLTVYDDQQGLYKFRDWLPMKRMLKCDVAPVTYRSEGLAKALGLEN
ncbi:MAG: cysteate synthase, partial [Alistipes sp.]|nr:cysteate synthase [Alistipes sp.]